MPKSNNTIFIQNLPFDTTNEKLESFFNNYGSIKRSFVVKNSNSSSEKDHCRGYGYVTFNTDEEASNVIKKSLIFNNRKINITLAKPKILKNKKSSRPENENIEISNSNSENLQNKDNKSGQVKKYTKETATKKSLSKARLIVRNLSFKCNEKDLMMKFSEFGEVLEIIIPTFNKTNLNKNDEKYNNRKVLKKGFAVIQMDSYKSAMKAYKAINEQIIIDRPVAVDFLMPKSEYFEKLQNNVEGNKTSTLKRKFSEEESKDIMITEKKKLKHDSNDQNSINSEDEVNMDGNDKDIDSDEDINNHSEDEDSMNNSDENSCSQSDMDDYSNSSGEDDDKSETYCGSNDSSSDSKNKKNKNEKRKNVELLENKNLEKLEKENKNVLDHLRAQQDLEKKRTLFIRNLSYDAVDEDLIEIFEEFGQIKYCRVVLNKKTEHSQGTAFVCFKNSKSVEECLKAASNELDERFLLNGRRLNISLAVTKSEAEHLTFQKKGKEVEKKQGDQRNLHLIRLTLIRPGTQAAEGLSKEDLMKRVKIEQITREKLKNPNVFVSPTRLCIRNIPVSVDDKQLKKVFLQASGNSTAKIKECRIMRDLQRLNSEGVGKSRGYGFVEFSSHDDALAAVNNTNNNPDVFGDKKRLMVEFSLENKAALIAKQARFEKSKMKNQQVNKKGLFNKQDKNLQMNNLKRNKTNSFKYPTIPNPNKKSELPSNKHVKDEDTENSDNLKMKQNSGSKNKDKKQKKQNNILPSHWGPKIRHKKRPGVLAMEDNKKKLKKKKQKLFQQTKRDKEPKIKKKNSRSNHSDNLDNLIAKYKKKFTSALNQ